MDRSVAVKKFVDRIKQQYSERRLNREKQWPPYKSEKLVRLELVEGEKQQGYSAGRIRGKGDKAVKQTPLAYSDVLKARDGAKKIVRKVLVEGDAGIGKTTLCTAVSEDWANGKLFQEFEILLLLYLRQRKIALARSLLSLLQLLHASPKVCKLVAEYIEEEDGKVLVIADGWDELSAEDRSEGSFLYELLFGECYSLSVIVTSRPYASASIRDLQCIDRLVEVCGFGKENIKEFIRCEFAGGSNGEEGSGLLKQLEDNPLIQSVCSVPLNCAIVSHLWHHYQGSLPTTMTELYTKIVLNVILRNMKKIPQYENVPSLSQFDAVPDSLQQPWSLLCELAFQTLCEDRIIFSYGDVRMNLHNLTLDSKVLCFGLLQLAESIFVDGHGVSFHFLHLTFQEYLAALYLVRQPTDKQLQLCQSYVGSQRFKMVWRFFFGISFTVYDKPVDSNVSKVLLESDCNDITLTLCHYAFEASNRSMDLLVASKVRDGAYVTFMARSGFDSAAIIHVLANVQDCQSNIILVGHGNYSASLGDKQSEALAGALAGEHRKLRVCQINLSGNMLSDQSVACLFDKASPAFSQSLWNIQLGNNMIGPKAINSITTVLANSLLVQSPDYSVLDISDNPLEVEGLKALIDALHASKLSNLVELSLSGSLTNDADANAQLILALGLGNCRSLRWLDLSRNYLGVPGGKALGNVLPHLCGPLSLHLSETKLGDEGFSSFTFSLEDTCDLNLASNDIHATGVSCLAESVCAGSTSLQCDRLNLANNPLGLEGARALLRILSSDHFKANLVYLTFSGCQLTAAEGNVTDSDRVNAVDIKQLVYSQLLQTDTICNIIVDKNDFGGEGIHILAAIMYVCPSMAELDCRFCGITSDDLNQLLLQLSLLKLKFLRLRQWDLNDNDIDDDGVSALIEHLSIFPFLRIVDLDGNVQISPGLLETLTKKLATSQKVHPYGTC